MTDASAERRMARRSWWHAEPRYAMRCIALMVVLGTTGCSLDGLLNSEEIPRNLNDPAFTETPEGAQAAYYGTLAQFRRAFGAERAFVEATGRLSDELLGISPNDLDQRAMTSNGADVTYSEIQKVRGQAGQALGLLTTYLSDKPALAGHLYALEGYAEIFLAELFCSGIPLSTLDYGGDFTYRPGSTTDAVLAHAVMLFDSALALAGDSAAFLNLARVGRARALLARGQYAEAAATVAAVADGYRYDVHYGATSSASGGDNWWNFARVSQTDGKWGSIVPDREGFNGLDWRTSGDPRTPIEARGTNTTSGAILLPLGATLWYPDNYDPLGANSIVLASGVEARLIEAEAALQAGSAAWLTTLNALRTDGTFDTQPTADPNDDPAAMDTLWHAGSGGVDSLAPLEDPGTQAGRVDLLFRERAFWLFLTGHRQGDLRRLIRQYGRSQDATYPVGFYYLLETYGSDVTVPIPESEFINPLYTGCASRAA